MQHVLITYCIYLAGIAFICGAGAIKLSDILLCQAYIKGSEHRQIHSQYALGISGVNII